jgi:hypothetical protein
LEKVLVSSDGLTLEELAKRLGRNTRDGRYKVKTRLVAPLLKANLLVERDGVYSVPVDIEERLEAVLDLSGCNEARRLQKERYERQQDEYRAHLRSKGGSGEQANEKPLTNITALRILGSHDRHAGSASRETSGVEHASA